MATLAEVLERAKKKAASNNRMRTAKPKMGKSVWRILPGWDPKDRATFFHAFGQHFIKGPDGKVKAVINCPDKTYDESCEICEAVADAARDAINDKAREKILESRAAQRFLMNAVSVDEDKTKAVILEVGSMLFNDILLNLEEDPTILDPTKGRDLVITREGTGLNTKYSLAVRSHEKSMAVTKSLIMGMHDLGEYVKDDFEANKKKALQALGLATGSLTGSPQLTADVSDIDDEIPDFSMEEAEKLAADEIEDADVSYDEGGAEDTPGADDAEFGADVSDDDLDELLAGLD